MAIIASWSGKGLADGAPVGTGTSGPGDTPFTTVTADAVTVDDSGLHAPRLQVDQEGATEAELIWDSTVVGTSLTAWAVRVYVELSGHPPSNGGRLVSAYTSANTLLWFLDLTTAGLLRLRNAGGSAVDTSDAPLPTGTELRIEAVHADGDVVVTVYVGDGDSALTSVSSTGLGTGSGLEAVRVGMPAASPTWPTFWLDEIAVADEAAEIGPVPAPPEPEPPGPRFPLRDRVELLLAGTWTDVTGFVYERDEVSISRGRSAEAQEADPSQMSLTLDNRDGRFSPRNPTSPYYGVLGRNTRVRLGLPYGSSYLRVGPGDGSHITCPSAPALGITGDLDIRIEVDAEQWRAGDLAGRYRTAGDHRSWWLGIEDGRPQLIWSPDGTFAARLVAWHGQALPVDRGRLALRATLDVDDGAGGWVVRFFVADTIAGPWVQHGADITGTGTTSVHAGTAPIEVGGVGNLNIAASTLGVSAIEGKYLAFELRDGVDGTLVADPDFTTQAPGASSIADDQGNTWTIDQGWIDDHLWRFTGEVAEWPATWRMGGHDAYVKVNAAGIRRRLVQNAPSIRSPMTREFSSPERAGIVAYWPMEDASEATQIATAIPGARPARVSGEPALGDYSGWTASDPVPTMRTGSITGDIQAYPPTGELEVRAFVFMPFGGLGDGGETSLLQLRTGGTVGLWDVRLLPNGNLRTSAWHSDGTQADDGPGFLDSEIAFRIDLRGFLVLAFQVWQDGGALNWATRIHDFTNTDVLTDWIPSFSISGTLPGQTVGIARSVTIGQQHGLNDVKVGHLTVASSRAAYAAVNGPIAAWNGENPIDRMDRLAREEGVVFEPVTLGTAGNPVTLGDQPNRSLVELLQEAADTDGGILYEPRDVAGFAYRSRLSMYNQSPRVVLDYSGRQVAGDLVPVDDDRSTRNDITAKRIDGSSVHVEQTSGPLSTAPPPDGVGRYTDEIELSLTHDGQLADHAGWRLHLGTVDEARYPQLTINLRATGITGDLYDQILGLDIGDRIVLTGIPEGLPREDVSMLVQGYSETLRRMQHEIVLNLSPESPWRVGQVETPGFDRVDSGTSALTAPAAADATTLSITAAGIVWTTDPDDFPFDVMVAGERVTVTGITGASAPQTFTVIRSVNGVVKAQQAGAQVRLPDPVYVAL